MPSITALLDVMEPGKWYRSADLATALGCTTAQSGAYLVGAYSKRKIDRREVLGTLGSGWRRWEWRLA